MSLNEDCLQSTKLIFEKCGFKATQVIMEAESADYYACHFKIDGRSVRYRQAKVTPTKNGQFVTLWKRVLAGPIQPYDSADKIDFAIVSVKSKNHFGLFIFPKEVLVKRGIFSVKDKGGKRAIRVYPSWDKPESQQAEKTQKWQLDFFLDISNDLSIDIMKCKSLFSRY